MQALASASEASRFQNSCHLLDKASLLDGQSCFCATQVNAIVFVGIGLLLTFVRRYSYSALTLTLLGGTLAVLLGIIVMGLVQQYGQSGWNGKVKLDLPLFIDANFAACAAIISIGAFLGKATPTQVLELVFCCDQLPIMHLCAAQLACCHA